MPDPSMQLPPGETCGTCAHVRRCVSLGFTSSRAATSCDFAPSRFHPAPRKDAPMPAQPQPPPLELAFDVIVQEVGSDDPSAIATADLRPTGGAEGAPLVRVPVATGEHMRRIGAHLYRRARAVVRLELLDDPQHEAGR